MKKCPKCGTTFSLLDLLSLNFHGKIECKDCHSHLKFKTIPYFIFMVTLVSAMGFVIVQYAYPNIGYYNLVVLSSLMIMLLLLIFFPIEVKKSR